MPSHRYILAGLRYSDNLGDGIIAECLAYAICKHDRHAHIEFLDLSGRTGYARGTLPGKACVQKILRALPGLLATLLAAPAVLLWLLRGPFWRWQNLLSTPGNVVIGGGQLLLDHHLNFPLKLALLTWLCRRNRRPTAIHAVGVSRHWGILGSRLFRCVVSPAPLVSLSVRDKISTQILRKHLSITARLAPDPALLAAEVYANVKPTAHGCIGINLADPAELALYATDRTAFDPAAHLACWQTVIERLLAGGEKVALFTNGAHEDEMYLQRLLARLERNATHSNLSVFAHARTPAQLVAHIRGLKLLIGHRLHASIVAFAFGVPTVGLAWDEKLASFYTAHGFSRHLIPAGQFNSNRPHRAMTLALKNPPAKHKITEAKQAALKSVAKLVRVFQA